MKATGVIGALTLLFLLAACAAGWQWWKADQLRVENELLSFKNHTLEEQVKALAVLRDKQRDAEVERLRAEAGQTGKLRDDLNQSRLRLAELDKVRQENQQLRVQNQQLRTAIPPPSVPDSASEPAKSTGKFSKETWSNAGFSTPESTLISSLWAMREGKPQAYLDSLSPDEQARMAQRWANQSEAEIAAKHQSDISFITGLQVMSTQDISPTEKQMTVFIEGPNRTQTVSMQLIGNDWKFGGYVKSTK